MTQLREIRSRGSRERNDRSRHDEGSRLGSYEQKDPGRGVRKSTGRTRDRGTLQVGK